MNSRRVFLEQASLTIAATLAAALNPDARGMAAVLPQGALLMPLAAPVDAGWHVDDMWGPRYAEPVPYLHLAEAPDLTVLAHPADHNLIRA